MIDSNTFDRMVCEATEALKHANDGPVTACVVMSRAIEAARKGSFPPVKCAPLGYTYDPLTEALSVALACVGNSTIPSGEF